MLPSLNNSRNNFDSLEAVSKNDLYLNADYSSDERHFPVNNKAKKKSTFVKSQ